jgi:hypothetical protein
MRALLGSVQQGALRCSLARRSSTEGAPEHASTNGRQAGRKDDRLLMCLFSYGLESYLLDLSSSNAAYCRLFSNKCKTSFVGV